MIRRGRYAMPVALVAILAAALNLRIGVTEVGPLLDRIRADTGMSAFVAGVLGSIPFVCMGVFAPLGMRLVLRMNARPLMAGCMVLMVAGTAARAVAPTGWLVVAATLPLGIGIAIAGVALPGVIRTHFPRRTGAAMGAYVAALSFGAAVTALTMVPLSRALGGWRGAFAVSIVPTLAGLLLWLLLPSQGRPAPVGARPEPGPRAAQPASRIALLVGVFGFQSVCFAAVTNWVAALYHHAGWSLGAAGLTTALVSILVLPGALVIPALSDRGERGRWLMGAAVAMATGMFGMAFAPTAAAWLWILAFGIGNGALFPLALTLPHDLADDDHGRTLLTAWMLGLGYALSGTGPLLVGALLDLTGGFVVPMALLGVIGLFSGICGLAPGLRRRAAPSATVALTSG